MRIFLKVEIQTLMKALMKGSKMKKVTDIDYEI